MSQQTVDNRFMGLAGARVKPPGEFLSHTLVYIAKGWVHGFYAILASLFPFSRRFIEDGSFWVPLWALVAILSISLISSNFYYGWLTKQPDNEALIYYAPKIRPYLNELLLNITVATMCFLVIYLLKGALMSKLTGLPFAYPNPWTYVLLGYPFATTYLLLGEFRKMDMPHIYMCIQAWTYCLPGVPTTANTTPRDLRRQIIGKRKEAFNGRRAYLSLMYAVFSFFLFYSLLEVFDTGYAFFMSPFFSLWCLASTLAIAILPIVKEIQDVRVLTEVEEYRRRQKKRKSVFSIRSVNDSDEKELVPDEMYPNGVSKQ